MPLPVNPADFATGVNAEQLVQMAVSLASRD
jgi:hypothetical protein